MLNKAEESLELEQFEQLITGLIDNGYGCCDDFMNKETITGLRNNLLALHKAGEMYPSGIGSKKDFQKNTLIRGDKIKWLEDNSQNTFEKLFQHKIGRFIQYLNSSCYTSINTSEFHYASYEKGSFYKRHIDQFKTNSERKFSLILYLNENWRDEDGGLLSLYPKNANQIDVAPLEGRLMFFKSDEMEHEVHPSYTRSRLSIPGWLKHKH